MALGLWRDDNFDEHPKGSCAGCHGADYFDLAVIGSTDEDIRRRAIIDGATQEEADALVQAVNAMREDMNLPAADARSFRPLQPGGEVLLPDLTDSRLVASVRRDIAFGQQLEDLLPTLFGPRIDSLSDALRARDEMLDLVNGTSIWGANPDRLDLRSLPVGITYPLWSADLHHGAEEGTFNDWISDVSRDPPPENREAWLAAQDAYLADPNTENFWRMWLASVDLTDQDRLNDCIMDGSNSGRACEGARSFNKHKFRAALMGQHIMRVAVLDDEESFMSGPLAFSYLDDDPVFDFMLDRTYSELLPADLWEIGDRSRVMFSNSQEDGSFHGDLIELGFPEFVLDSIDPAKSASQEQHDLRLTWFWIGFTFDPSFARMHQSNATKTAEYMIGTLLRENMHMHNALQGHMRLIAKGYLPEANRSNVNRQRELRQDVPRFRMNYNYFVRYGRSTIRWIEDFGDGESIPQELRDQQQDLWVRMNGNGFRMSLYLYLEGLNGGWVTEEPTFLDDIRNHFNTYWPETAAEDNALIDAVIAASIN